MRGQMHLMENVFMMLFIVMVIIALIFFLTGWHIAQLRAEESRGSTERSLTFTRQFLDSPYFVNDNGIFDDGKLTALASFSDSCARLQGIFGKGWFMEIRIWDGSGDDVPCTWGNYPDCNYWTFCREDREYVSYMTPVNIYRKIGFVLERGTLGSTYLGTLEVGIYA